MEYLIANAKRKARRMIRPPGAHLSGAERDKRWRRLLVECKRQGDEEEEVGSKNNKLMILLIQIQIQIQINVICANEGNDTHWLLMYSGEFGFGNHWLAGWHRWLSLS